uniref:Plasma membrane proteolipid 3 n=1 Tax=Strongyloides venezuelensis TaxID=75913 RepID=A0A0K0F5M4_STRVS
MARTCCFGILLLILVVVFPPLAVLLDDGCDAQFVINVLLTLLFYIPGLVHGFWVCFIREKPQTVIFNTNYTV